MQIPRRNFASILNEVVQAVGGHDYLGFPARAQHAVWSTYLDLALTYHHYELEASTEAMLGSATREVPIPASCYAVIAVIAGVLAQGMEGAESYGYLVNPRRAQFALGDRWAAGAEKRLPTEWTRYGNNLLFNGPSSGSVGLRIYYYRTPTQPDFDLATAYSELHPMWDDHLIEGAVAKLQKRIWRPDIAQANLEFLSRWLQEQVQPALGEDPIGTLPDMTTASRPIGGKQG